MSKHSAGAALQGKSPHATTSSAGTTSNASKTFTSSSTTPAFSSCPGSIRETLLPRYSPWPPNAWPAIGTPATNTPPFCWRRSWNVNAFSEPATERKIGFTSAKPKAAEN